jgi:hypothetical protein
MGCGSSGVPSFTVIDTESPTEAAQSGRALVESSASAHGGNVFEELNDLAPASSDLLVGASVTPFRRHKGAWRLARVRIPGVRALLSICSGGALARWYLARRLAPRFWRLALDWNTASQRIAGEGVFAGGGSGGHRACDDVNRPSKSTASSDIETLVDRSPGLVDGAPGVGCGAGV